MRDDAVRPGPVPAGTRRPAPPVRPEDRHAHHRAVPRRRRFVPPAEGVPATARKRSAARTTSSSSSTRCRRTSAAPGDCSPSRPTASSRTSSCSARGWATASRSRRRSAGRTCSRSLDYGEGSDTWSANPLCCAAVLATLDEFAARDVLGEMRRVVRGDRGGPGRAEGVAVRRPRPRRERRHGLGRRDARPRRPDRGRVGERLRAGLLPGRRPAATASTCSARWRRRWSASPRRWSSRTTRRPRRWT